MKFLPMVSGTSSIQRISALKLAAWRTWLPFSSTQPRETSTSRFSWIVTGWPLKADSASRSATRIFLTWASSPLGLDVTVSPTAMLPLSICPWNPRNSWFGRQTRWTDM